MHRPWLAGSRLLHAASPRRRPTSGAAGHRRCSNARFGGLYAGGPEKGAFPDRMLASQELVYPERDYVVGEQVRRQGCAPSSGLPGAARDPGAPRRPPSAAAPAPSQVCFIPVYECVNSGNQANMVVLPQADLTLPPTVIFSEWNSYGRINGNITGDIQ